MITREIQLAAQIAGAPALDDFTVATTEVDGEVLVRTDQVGLAATYLELMRADCTIPVPAWQPGRRVGVAAIGTVIRSDSPELAVGDLVQSMTGWSEYSAGPAAQYIKLDPIADPGYHLGQGPTAYYGMADVAGVGEGDVVFVSGAAGGVGSLSSQLGGAAERFPEPDHAAAQARGVELLPFSCHHTADQIAAWREHFGTWLGEGRFVYPQTVVKGGIEDVPQAFLSLLQGSYRGNVSVRLS
ncbi:NADP-dependent oxidoreductase [Streptosporangium canum]|uniref:NADP-dependent oxidoreductase n=1 Tax=Streptosporangium canum TaxID=324952 RepID=UPI0036B2CEFF